MRAVWLDPEHGKKPKMYFPQCDAERITKYRRDKPGSWRKCTRPAVVNIDGKNYCAQHGGKIALQQLVENQ